MINQKEIALALGIGLIIPSTGRADVSCTASPDCSLQGYTKSAADCPGGSVKCPFDQTKLFCLKGGGGNVFAIKNKVNNLDIVYSDGTTASTLNTAKDAIGVALVFETNNGYNHGIIVSAHQPPATTWTNAVKRCNDFVVKGTSEGDWRLPTLFEMIEINGWETESSTGTNQYANLNNKMKLLPQAEQLGYSYLFNYCNSGANDYGGTYLKESPVCSAITVSCSPFCPNNGIWQYSDDCKSSSGSSRAICSCPSHPATAIYTNTYYWSMSDQTGSNNYIYGNLSSTTGWGSAGSASAKYGHYRCVANF